MAREIQRFRRWSRRHLSLSAGMAAGAASGLAVGWLDHLLGIESSLPLPPGVAHSLISALVFGMWGLLFGRDPTSGGFSRKETERRLEGLRKLLVTTDAPHVADIYELLDDDREEASDPVGQLHTLTDRFVAGFMSAEEYDTALRRQLEIPGRGLPVR